MRRIQTGIRPLDERTGGLKVGGLYVLAGAPGSGKLDAVLQFLHAGLDAGDRVALLTTMVPEQVVERARYLGFDFQMAWEEGRLTLLGFAQDFDRLLLSAAEPAQAFGELSELVGRDVARIGLDPGKPLWETRAGTSLASRFVSWGQSTEATLLVTIASELSDTATPATEWVLQSATGVLKIERMPNGLRQLSVHRLSPPIDHEGTISLEIVPGKGLCEPAGRFDRRSTDTPIGSEHRLLLLALAQPPDELLAWARSRYDTVELSEPLELVSRLQEGEEYGLIILVLDRGSSHEATETCRAVRPLTGAPIVLATDDRLRATDRTQALDAGANDFLSDNFSLVELASRIGRAMRVGGALPRERRSEGASAAQPGGVLETEEFARRIEERLHATQAMPFAMIQVACGAAERRELGEVLVRHVRDSEDCVGRTSDGFAVVLHGARPRQAHAYLNRVRETLDPFGNRSTDFRSVVLSSATDGDAIREALQAAAA